MAVSRLEDCWRPGKAVDLPRTRRGYVFVEVHAPQKAVRRYNVRRRPYRHRRTIQNAVGSGRRAFLMGSKSVLPSASVPERSPL